VKIFAQAVLTGLYVADNGVTGFALIQFHRASVLLTAALSSVSQLRKYVRSA
jgi:hypothetical protein